MTLGIPASAGDIGADSYACGRAKGDEAIAACGRIIKLGLEAMSAQTMSSTLDIRGELYENKGDHDRAIADFDQAIKFDPRNALAYIHRGGIHRKRGDSDRALADATQAIKLSPKSAVAYVIRGNAYAERGEDDRAIDDLGEAIRLDPKNAGALVNRGVSYGNRGEYDLAIADFDHVIKLEPKNAGAYSNRGEVYQKMGNPDRAIADFDQAVKLDPKNAGAYRNRGIAYNSKGDRDHAVADFDHAIVLGDQAIKLDPKNAVAFVNRGLAYENKGDHDRAAADFNQAIKLNPTLANARINRQRPQETAASLQTPVSNQIAPLSQAGSAAAAQAGSPPATQERRVALVIGNSQYSSARFLPNPRRDAKAVADVLRQVGFQSVELAMDLDRDAMVKALRSFRSQADNADWALVYFAGHGIEIDRTNYLIPVDARLVDDRDVKAETVSYEELLGTVSGARSLRLVILDACRVNPFKDYMRRTVATRGDALRGLAPPPESEPGTLVVYSAKDGEVAIDDIDGVNSPFARAFVAELKVPGREVRRLFDYVRDDVLDATNKRQQPFTYGSLPGRKDFFFVSAK